MAFESPNKMELMVLTDLAAICKKVAEDTTVPEQLRVDARQFVEQFDSLMPAKATTSQHAERESLLFKMSRFLPRLLEVDERAIP